MTGRLLALLKGQRFVNCWRKENEEEKCKWKQCRSGDDEVQHTSELDVVKAEMAIALEDLMKTIS